MASAELPLMMTYLPFGTAAKIASGLHPADLDVVERDVERVGILDQAVIGDHGYAGRDRALATDGLMAVPSWARTMSTLAPCEMRFSMLLACVSADDLASFDTYGAAAGLDRRLERRLVPLRPALFLVVVPRHADDAVAARGSASGRVGASGRRALGRSRRVVGRCVVVVIVAARGHHRAGSS